MRLDLDLKAIGYAVLTFVLGVTAIAFLGNVLAPQSFIALAALIPIATGSMASHYAPSRHYIHGAAATTIGAILVMAPLLLIPGPSISVAAILPLYIALGCLGTFIERIGNRRSSP